MIDQKHQHTWTQILQNNKINSDQEQQFLKYLQLLLEENQKYNLTAITNVDDVMLDHFADSLSILHHYDMSNVQRLIDVGSGGGFPGIPLAIMLPDVAVCLIEVNLKKVYFLNLVVQMLGLKNVTVRSDDWRTFLRSDPEKLKEDMDPRLREDEGNKVLVVARASLQVDELLRMFKPSSHLKNATLVYWASKKWVPTVQEKEYLKSCVEYNVGQKQRNLCFFKLS
jgi:16S rRNA (guanine527-N7)-methyltransferase